MMSEERKKPIFYQPSHEKSRIGRVIAVMSGKGGVGKSLVTGLSALAVARSGKKVGILDADITGPSIPASFGVKPPLPMVDGTAYAARSAAGIQIVSTNLILPNETDPIIWKGPMIAQGVKQFWSDIVWEDVDVLFVDMPPGTGDVPLTVFQTLPVDGILIVTSPQELVSMIVEKAINMARMMGVKVLGMIENMSYFRAPDTGTEYKIFGESHVDEVAAEKKIPVLAKLPLDPAVAETIDAGRIEELDTRALEQVVNVIAALPQRKE